VTDQQTVVRGCPFLPGEKERFEQLQALFSPEANVRLLDEVSRWIFAAAGFVGTLGASFGVSGSLGLNHEGRRIFAAGVVCVAVSLGLAGISRTPIWRWFNPYSPDSLEATFRGLVFFRFFVLAAVSVLLAAAFVLAGVATLFPA
jgi:hypothetical protein